MCPPSMEVTSSRWSHMHTVDFLIVEITQRDFCMPELYSGKRCDRVIE